MASAALPLTTVAVLDTPMHLATAIPLTTGRCESGEAPAEIRRATVADAPAIHALINANLAAGHLLPRTADDVTRRATRFLVVTVDDDVVGCAELAPLSRAVAEVRSLVVDESCRGRGFGSRIVEELHRWAVQEGFSTLCAFTHNAAHFVRLGFSIVPHPWLPEKIATDCVGCPKFRQCTQYADGAAAARPLAADVAGRPAAVPGDARVRRADRAAPGPHHRRRRRARVVGATDFAPLSMEPSTLSSSISVVPGGVTAPAGFRTAGVHCGIKARAGALDLMLLVADGPASAAGAFTISLAAAAPVLVSKAHLAATGGRARAIVVNSGCANACTGDAGHKVAELMTAETARALGCEAEEVLVASTGVIGVSLDPRTVDVGDHRRARSAEPRRRTPTRRARS